MADEWHYPAPAHLTYSHVTEGGYRLAWQRVTGPAGQDPTGYTVQTRQLDDVIVDTFVAHGTETSEYGRGGQGMHPGWTYKTRVWANGGPEAPPHAEVTVTLRPKIQPEPAPRIMPSAPIPAPVPVGPSTQPAQTAQAQARGTPPPAVGHPSLWQPWQAVITHAEARMRTEIQEALKEYDQAVTRAGHALDVAYTIASTEAGRLEDAAWAAWEKTMAQAGQVADRVLGPAVREYQGALERAHTMFDKAMSSAEAAYKQTVSDASRAQKAAPPSSTAA